MRPHHLGEVGRVHTGRTDDTQPERPLSSECGRERFRGQTRLKSSNGKARPSPLTGGPSSGVRGVMRLVSEEMISAIREKAQLARRLSGEASNCAAKTTLLEKAALAP